MKISVVQAAKRLNCNEAHVRKLLGCKKIKGKLRTSKIGSRKFWEVDSKSVTLYKRIKQTKGWPRGVARS